MSRSYRELLVWQKAKALAVHTYKATADFPRTETQLAIALDLGFLERSAYDTLEQESYQVLGLLNRLLNSLIKKTA